MKFLSSVVATLALLLCVGCNQYQSKKTSAPAKLSEVILSADTTMYVVLESSTSNTIDVTLLETGEPLQLNYSSEEDDATPIRGELNDGDTLAITIDSRTSTLVNCVNISELVGLWMFEDLENVGLKLNTDGTAQPIGDVPVSVHSWFIHNGKLVLTYIPADGSDYTPKADTTGVLTLDGEQLEISMGGASHMAKRQPALLTR